MSPWLPDVRPGTDAAGASYSEPPAVRQGKQFKRQWSVVTGHWACSGARDGLRGRAQERSSKSSWSALLAVHAADQALQRSST